MSASRPSREVAHRLFAVEFDDAEVTHTESEDEMAPSYVITPTGAMVNRAFVVGTLTSVDQVGDDIYRGRIADPTDTFVTYAGQYQPNPANFLAEAATPSIVALTGKARTFQPDGSDDILSSLRPERIVETTPATRDHWVLETATHTLGRVELLARVRAVGLEGEDAVDALTEAGVPSHVATGISLAIEAYKPSPGYLDAVAERAIEAIEVVAGERDAVDPLELATDAPSGDQTYAALADRGFIQDWLGVDPTIEAPPKATAMAETAGSSEAEATTPPAPPEVDPDPNETTNTEVEPDNEDTEELYELSDAERAEVEEEYGVDFATGDEVESPDESAEPTEADEVDLPDESTEEVDPEPADEPEDEPEATVDLEETVLEQMRELDDGDGVDRQVLIEAITDVVDAGTSAIDDAIQDALMSGSCYEPTEGRLKPI